MHSCFRSGTLKFSTDPVEDSIDCTGNGGKSKNSEYRFQVFPRGEVFTLTTEQIEEGKENSARNHQIVT
jgi:hypothetical protein